MKCPSPQCFFRLSVVRFISALVLILAVLPALAQNGSGSMSQSPLPESSPLPHQPTARRSPNDPWDVHDMVYGNGSKPDSSKISTDYSCFLPPLEGSAPVTVRVSDLQIPAKTRREYGAGCLAVKKGKMSDAEHHFRKAVNQWPKYSAAWVVLGQVLEAQQKTRAAKDACSQPLTAEPDYLPSWLCLADISAHTQDWNKVLSLSTRALTINSTTVAVAYDYNAAAYFHLHNLPQAEKSALRAVEIDRSNIDPRVHFLLAQIYEAKGDRNREAAQLREYLKYASDPNDRAMVEHYLSQIEKRTQ